MGYDKKHRLVTQFQPGLEVEPLYRLANFKGQNSYEKEFTISGTALNSVLEFKEECVIQNDNCLKSQSHGKCCP